MRTRIAALRLQSTAQQKPNCIFQKHLDRTGLSNSQITKWLQIAII
jgi:hypothetical protein